MPHGSPRSAEDPWVDGVPPHIPIGSRALPTVVLLPGDPARVDLAEGVLDDFELVGNSREFRLAVGRRNGREIAICSTGIGGPSTEIAIVELSRIGVTTFIRVGGMGAVKPSLHAGTITRVDSVLREGGAARFYDPSADPVPAHPDVAAAITAAARSRGTEIRGISVLSCDSYYLGEGRRVAGLETLATARMSYVDASNADALDMECETVFVIARALGRRYGAVLVTHANRATDEWLEDYEPAQLEMLEIAADAAALLSGMAQ